MIATFGPWSSCYGLRSPRSELSIIVTADSSGIRFMQQPLPVLPAPPTVHIEEIHPVAEILDGSVYAAVEEISLPLEPASLDSLTTLPVSESATLLSTETVNTLQPASDDSLSGLPDAIDPTHDTFGCPSNSAKGLPQTLATCCSSLHGGCST